MLEHGGAAGGVQWPETATQRYPSLPNLIEQMGMGPAQVIIGVLGGGVWFADGAELLLIGAVTNAVANEWGLDHWQRGLIVSIVFVGVLLGNTSCGPLGDIFGRRLPILVSYVGIAAFSLLSAFSVNYYMLCGIRLGVGFAFGVGQPAAITMTTEVSPVHWRVPMMGNSMNMFTLGEVYSCALIWWDDPDMKHMNWRWLLAMGAIPAVLFAAFAAKFLPQSPMHLAKSGKTQDAMEALSWINTWNGNKVRSLDYRSLSDQPSIENDPWNQKSALSIIFSRKYAYSTLAIVYSTFVVNLVYYGCLYALPQVMTEVDMGVSPALSLLFGAMWEFPGNIAGVVCSMLVKRKPTMIMCLLCMAPSMLAFGYGATAASGRLVRDSLVHGGYIGMKFLPLIQFLCVYQYASELYPTMARSTGNSLCLAGGRIGSILAPMIYEWILVVTGRFEMFFYFLAFAAAVNVVLVVFLPFETFGKQLDEDEDTPILGH